MNIRQEVEKLAYWYISGLALVFILGIILSNNFIENGDMGKFIAYGMSGTGLLMGSLHKVIISIWLFFLAKKTNQRYILWGIIGFAGHWFSVVIFLGLYVYEQSKLAKVNTISQETD